MSELYDDVRAYWDSELQRSHDGTVSVAWHRLEETMPEDGDPNEGIRPNYWVVATVYALTLKFEVRAMGPDWDAACMAMMAEMTRFNDALADLRLYKPWVLSDLRARDDVKEIAP
jgi:hypothetical protein